MEKEGDFELDEKKIWEDANKNKKIKKKRRRSWNTPCLIS
jgi:hypothetical protein